MKCLISFLLIVFLGNLVNCLPYDDKDYLETIKDIRFLFGEGSGQVESESESSSAKPTEESTTSLSTQDVIESTTSADLVELSSSTSVPEDASENENKADETTPSDDLAITTSAPEEAQSEDETTTSASEEQTTSVIEIESTSSTTEEQTSSVSETTTTQKLTEPLKTTTTTEIPSIYTKDILKEKITARFSDLRVQFIAAQKEMVDQSRKELNEHKATSFALVDLFQNKYNRELTQINENIRQLQVKRSEIEESIKTIQENSSTDGKNADKLKELKDRKIVLENFKVQGCEECQEFLDDHTIDNELENIDNQIAKLENKVDVTQGRKKFLDSKEIQLLNAKYLELIHVYKLEIEEQKRKENLESLNKMTQDKLRNYSEFVEKSLTEEIISIKNFTQTFIDLEKLKSKEGSSDGEDSSVSCIADVFNWKKFESKEDTRKNGVFAGTDLDGSEVYIIRKNEGDMSNDENVFYGKVALRTTRNDAYVTTRYRENAVDDNKYEILVTKRKYKWCKSESYKLPKGMPPICRAKKSGIDVPGTIVDGSECRIGFGYDVIKYTENYEILSFSNCRACLSNVKMWF